MYVIKRLLIVVTILAVVFAAKAGIVSAAQPENPNFLGEWMRYQAQGGTLADFIKQSATANPIGDIKDLPNQDETN